MSSTADDGHAARLRVLIIDDDPTIGRVLRRILEPAYACTVCGRADEALAALTGGARFEVILCDEHMPGLSGAEFRARLRATLPEQARRVVAVTGDHDDPADAASTLHKPWSLVALRLVVAAVASEGRTSGPWIGPDAPTS